MLKSLWIFRSNDGELSVAIASERAVKLHIWSQTIATLEVDRLHYERCLWGQMEGVQIIRSRGGRSMRASRQMLTFPNSASYCDS